MLNIRSSAYEQQGNFALAIADKEESLRLFPARTGWDVIPLAALYRNSGQPEQALTILRKMLSDHMGLAGKGTTPGMPSYYHLGQTLVALKKWPEAAEAFSEGLSYQIDYPWAYLYRALSYDHMNNETLARDDVKRARSLIRAMKDDVQAGVLSTMQKAPFGELTIKYPE